MDIYKEWMAVGRYKEGTRQRATLPAILPSHHHHPREQDLTEDTPENDEPDTTSRRPSRHLLHAVAEFTMSQRRSSSTQLLAHRRGSSSHSTSDKASNKGSHTLSIPEHRWTGATRRGSRGSIRRNSLSVSSTASFGARQWMRRVQPRDSLTEAEEKERAKKLLAKFRTWAHVVVAVSSLYRKYSQLERNDAKSPFYAQFDTIEKTTVGIDKNHYIFFDPSDYKANTQMRMSADGQRILSKPPGERTEEELHHVMIALRGIKLIEDLPVRMQKQLARYGTFERYEPKRIIVKEHQRPQAFYFMLYGTVLVAVLQESGYAKTEVELTRGHSFGELAIMNGTTRQSSVITKTPVELLCISEENYRRIFMVGGTKNFHDPDQIEFLSNLSFLNGWPLDLLTHTDPKLVTFAYFRCKTVMIKDSNRSDWIIIIKSGSVTVLKKLIKAPTTLNKRTGRHYHVANTDGFMAFQNNAIAYTRYLTYNNRTLPDPFTLSLNSSFLSESDGTTPRSDVTLTSDVTQSSNSFDDVDRFLRRVTRVNRPMTCTPRRKIGTVNGPRISLSAACGVKNPKRKHRISGSASTPPSSNRTDESSGTDDGSQKGKIRTFIDDLDDRLADKNHIPTEADLHPQFVLVQNLTKGQVFGLSQVVLGDQPSMCVVSNGAECLMINKRFYLDNCPPVLLRKLRTQVSPYPSDEKLQKDLTVRIDWDVYKQCVTRQVLAHKQRPVTHRKTNLGV